MYNNNNILLLYFFLSGFFDDSNTRQAHLQTQSFVYLLTVYKCLYCGNDRCLSDAEVIIYHPCDYCHCPLVTVDRAQATGFNTFMFIFVY